MEQLRAFLGRLPSLGHRGPRVDRHDTGAAPGRSDRERRRRMLDRPSLRAYATIHYIYIYRVIIYIIFIYLFIHLFVDCVHSYIYIHTVYVYRYERVQKCWIPQICLMENKMINHENLGYPLEIPANFSPKVILEWQPADRHYPG